MINKKAVIGKRCVILHNVTIGAKGPGNDVGNPNVGDDVYLGAGATILGSVKVGDGAVIGAGSVVTKEVPAQAVMAGNPARRLR